MKINYEFACQDDCLDKMVPSDLRQLVCERDQAYRNIDILKSELEALREQTRWRDVLEELPEIGQDVTTFNGHRLGHTAHINMLGSSGQPLWATSTTLTDVTHWMQLRSHPTTKTKD